MCIFILISQNQIFFIQVCNERFWQIRKIPLITKIALISVTILYNSYKCIKALGKESRFTDIYTNVCKHVTLNLDILEKCNHFKDCL